MKNWNLFIKIHYLKLIESEEKTVEGRVNYQNLRKIKVGDTITFISGEKEVITDVKRVSVYKDISDMLTEEKTTNLIPNETKEKAQEIYESIYPKQKVVKNGGMIAFEIAIQKQF